MRKQDTNVSPSFAAGIILEVNVTVDGQPIEGWGTPQAYDPGEPVRGCQDEDEEPTEPWKDA